MADEIQVYDGDGKKPPEYIPFSINWEAEAVRELLEKAGVSVRDFDQSQYTTTELDPHAG